MAYMIFHPLSWHPADFTLTSLTAGFLWETGCGSIWLELNQDEGQVWIQKDKD